MQKKMTGSTGPEDVDQDLARQYRHQAADDVVCKRTGAEDAEVLPFADADDSRGEGSDDQRHDRHAEQPEEDVGQRLRDRHDRLAEYRSGEHSGE
jgi:hypothetical protein